MVEQSDRVRQVASFVAWLDRQGCQRLMRMLLDESYGEAEGYLAALFSDLPEDLDLADAHWSEAVLDALEARIAPPDEDWDRAPTDLVPNYARYAQDLRSV